MIFTLTIHSIHSRYHFRPVLPLDRNHPLICSTNGFFILNDNTANLRHHLFHKLFLTFLKTFFTPSSLSISVQAKQASQNITKRIQTEQLTNNSQFYDNQETHQIKIYISSNILKDNNFKGLLLIKILSKPCLVANILNTATHELFIFTNHAVKQKKNYNNITVCLEIRQK